MSRVALAQSTLLEGVGATLTEMESGLVAFRRDLHRNPELSLAEVRTAAKVAERLRSEGIETRTGVGGHGVIGIVRGALPGPVVAYRADMDAVASDAPDPVDFASTVVGVRHICGHDVHTTIAIAVATALARHRRQLAGTVLFLFQPAEERASGAAAMLADGALREPQPSAIYALHTAPFPVGQLATVSGDMMSGHDGYEVTIRGDGDLRAATDTVRARLAAMNTVPATAIFEPGPRDLVLVNGPDVSSQEGGVLLRGFIVATSQSRPTVTRRMQELEALSLRGVHVSTDYRPKVVAGVFNDPELTPIATAAVERALGAGSVQPVAGIVPAFSEDFGSFQDRIPGVFFFLGVSNPAKGTVGMPHSPAYVADEGAILVGAKAMAAVLLDRLGRQ